MKSAVGRNNFKHKIGIMILLNRLNLSAQVCIPFSSFMEDVQKHNIYLRGHFPSAPKLWGKQTRFFPLLFASLSFEPAHRIGHVR